jgi:hypothetical protein
VMVTGAAESFLLTLVSQEAQLCSGYNPMSPPPSHHPKPRSCA